jgi:hypothetical protein
MFPSDAGILLDSLTFEGEDFTLEEKSGFDYPVMQRRIQEE